MSRELFDHKIDGLNDALAVEVLDEPGAGGACHWYKIHGPFHHEGETGTTYPEPCCIAFQKGPVHESGVNGVSNEAVLAVLIDRMRGFASGPFPCQENFAALAHMEEALKWLHKRTRDRLDRRVEGTNQK